VTVTNRLRVGGNAGFDEEDTMSKRSFLGIIRGKELDSFWDMNHKQQREFVRELLSGFKPAVNKESDKITDDATDDVTDEISDEQ